MAHRPSIADQHMSDRGLDGQMDARYQGILTVKYNGKRVTSASDAEMAAALDDLNRQIIGTTARIAVARIQSSKGL